jgi:hypothetical protein
MRLMQPEYCPFRFRVSSQLSIEFAFPQPLQPCRNCRKSIRLISGWGLSNWPAAIAGPQLPFSAHLGVSVVKNPANRPPPSSHCPSAKFMLTSLPSWRAFSPNSASVQLRKKLPKSSRPTAPRSRAPTSPSPIFPATEAISTTSAASALTAFSSDCSMSPASAKPAPP